MIRTLARLAAAALVVATLVPGVPAAAAPLQAVPPTVRVNVAGLGTISARIGSTGELVATAPDGRVLYRGPATLAARTNVHRIPGGIRLPDLSVPAADPEERASRLALLREARVALQEAGGARLELVPFELAAITGSDPMGAVTLESDKVVGVRFHASGGILTYDGRAYRGTLELALDDEDAMIVVNTVDTGHYLAAVVGSEVPTSWHPEALAAQAIAARTYLVTHLRRHAAYDLEGDTRDQEYDGSGSATASTVRAVERTTGVVATYGGGAIEALYSANAGGMTEDSENVYANALPYLRSVPSPWDEEAASSSWGYTSWEWTTEVTATHLGDQLRVRGIDVGDVRRIELAQLSPSGRVLRAHVVGTKGARDIGKDASRWYFGLRSSLFTVEQRPGGGIEGVPVSDVARQRELDALGARRTDTGYRVTWDDDHEIATWRLSSYIYELPDHFVFTGRGFGHGVGMSQWGAQGMALEGKGYAEILTYYYRGIALTGVGGP